MLLCREGNGVLGDEENLLHVRGCLPIVFMYPERQGEGWGRAFVHTKAITGGGLYWVQGVGTKEEATHAQRPWESLQDTVSRVS